MSLARLKANCENRNAIRGGGGSRSEKSASSTYKITWAEPKVRNTAVHKRILFKVKNLKWWHNYKHIKLMRLKHAAQFWAKRCSMIIPLVSQKTQDQRHKQSRWRHITEGNYSNVYSSQANSNACSESLIHTRRWTQCKDLVNNASNKGYGTRISFRPSRNGTKVPLDSSAKSNALQYSKMPRAALNELK